MTGTPFRVAYFDRPMQAAFLEVLARAPAVEVVRLDSTAAPGTTLAQLATCHGFYVKASRDELPLRWHVTPALLRELPALRLVASYGAGYDTIDLDACSAAGVAVVNQAGGNAEGVAEHAVGMMLALLKRMPEAHHAMLEGRAAEREGLMARELFGRCVGLVGFGHVGRRVAEILTLAFRCEVLVHDPYLEAATCAAHGARQVPLAELYAACDVVSAHCPLTAETRGMFDAAAFAAMRPGAIFVTTARGSIHDEAALHAALASGHLAGAGLDVWEREPPPPDHPLLHHPAVIATQHLAGVTFESRRRVASMAAEAFLAAAAGRRPPRVLNPEAAARWWS